MGKITVELYDGHPVGGQAVEIVERKGTGHPDSICDAALERVSVALSREYIKTFGAVLHHNIDKGLLVAGTVEKRFGGGLVTSPMELVVGDRATFTAGGKDVPVVEIAESAVRAWVGENLRHVDPEKNVFVRVALQPGSVELSDIFSREGRVMAANDTSAAVGYAPMTPTERAVLEVERFLNSPAFKLDFPDTGEDVKIMGVRTNRSLDLTVACPLLCGKIRSEKAYFERKKAVKDSVRKFLGDFNRRGDFDSIDVGLNTLDRKGEGVDGVYLSLLGTSAEDADSGQVGRGNRVNGVISLNRPMGTEAAAGKNPTSHVGKIYNVLSHRIAAELYERLGGADSVGEVYVWLLSRIGSPIDKPRAVYVRVVPAGKAELDPAETERKSEEVVGEFLAGIEAFTGELARGEYPVC